MAIFPTNETEKIKLEFIFGYNSNYQYFVNLQCS